jgi:hypothetical protein
MLQEPVSKKELQSESPKSVISPSPSNMAYKKFRNLKLRRFIRYLVSNKIACKDIHGKYYCGPITLILHFNQNFDPIQGFNLVWSRSE